MPTRHLLDRAAYQDHAERTAALAGTTYVSALNPRITNQEQTSVSNIGLAETRDLANGLAIEAAEHLDE